MMKALKMTLEFSSQVQEEATRGTPRKAVSQEESEDEPSSEEDNSSKFDEENLTEKDRKLIHKRNPTRAFSFILFIFLIHSGATRLFMKNLHPEVTDEKIMKTFSKCGKIEKIWFVKDRETNEFYGFVSL